MHCTRSLRLVLPNIAPLLYDLFVCGRRVPRLVCPGDKSALDGYDPGLGEYACGVEPRRRCHPFSPSPHQPECSGYEHEYGDNNARRDGRVTVAVVQGRVAGTRG